MGVFDWVREKLWGHHDAPPPLPVTHDEALPPVAHVPTGPGGGTAQANSNAFGHYAEPTGAGMGDVHLAEERQRQFDAWKGTDEGKKAGASQDAAKQIDLGYGHHGDHNPNEKLGDLSTGAGRDKALDMITQDVDGSKGKDSLAQHRCAAASLIGGALEGGGTQGLKELVKHMDEINGPLPKGVKDPLAALKAKLKDDETAKNLTVADMQNLQAQLYETLKFKMEGADPNKVAEDPDANGGVSYKTVAKFMQGDESLKKMFADNHMAIDNIDNSGDGQGKHFVLSMMDDKHNMQKVYDPMARDNGHQLMTDKSTVDLYDKARKYRADTEHNY